MDPRRAGASTVKLGSTSRAQAVYSGSSPLHMHGLRCCVSPGHLSWPLARPARMIARCASRGPVTANAVDDFAEVLTSIVKMGKVRAVGVSNFNAALMRAMHRCLAERGIPLASNQVAFNVFN